MNFDCDNQTSSITALKESLISSSHRADIAENQTQLLITWVVVLQWQLNSVSINFSCDKALTKKEFNSESRNGDISLDSDETDNLESPGYSETPSEVEETLHQGAKETRLPYIENSGNHERKCSFSLRPTATTCCC